MRNVAALDADPIATLHDEREALVQRAREARGRLDIGRGNRDRLLIAWTRSRFSVAMMKGVLNRNNFPNPDGLHSWWVDADVERELSRLDLTENAGSLARDLAYLDPDPTRKPRSKKGGKRSEQSAADSTGRPPPP